MSMSGTTEKGNTCKAGRWRCEWVVEISKCLSNTMYERFGGILNAGRFIPQHFSTSQYHLKKHNATFQLNLFRFQLFWINNGTIRMKERERGAKRSTFAFHWGFAVALRTTKNSILLFWRCMLALEADWFDRGKALYSPCFYPATLRSIWDSPMFQ